MTAPRRTIGTSDLERLPALARRQRLRLDGRPRHVVRRARRVHRRGRQLRRHGRRLLGVGARQHRRRLRAHHRRVVRRARQPRRRRPRDQGEPASRLQGPRRPTTSGAPPTRRSSACSTDYIDLYYAHFDDETVPLEETVAALSEPGRRRQGASHRHLELLARAHRGVVPHHRARGPAPRRRAAAALQPRRARLTKTNVPRRSPSARTSASCRTSRWRPGFLTGKYRDGVDGRQRRAPAAPPSTWTSAAARCSTALDEVAAAHRRLGRDRRARLARRPAHRRRADRQRPHTGAAARPARVRRAGAHAPTNCDALDDASAAEAEGRLSRSLPSTDAAGSGGTEQGRADGILVRLPKTAGARAARRLRPLSSLVEHFLGKEEVVGPIPTGGSVLPVLGTGRSRRGSSGG